MLGAYKGVATYPPKPLYLVCRNEPTSIAGVFIPLHMKENYDTIIIPWPQLILIHIKKSKTTIYCFVSLMC